MFIPTAVSMPALSPLHSWALILCLLGFTALIVKVVIAVDERSASHTNVIEQPELIDEHPTEDTSYPVTAIHTNSHTRDRVFDWNHH